MYISNWTVIYGNTIFKVENVYYYPTDTHRVFKRVMKDGSKITILSVPLSSILIKDGEGVKSEVINGMIAGPGFGPKTDTVNKTTVVQDNFSEGLVVGGIIGAMVF